MATSHAGIISPLLVLHVVVRMNFALDDALELAGEHFAADGGGVVRKEVPVQVGHFVLDHAGGKIVEGLRDLLQIFVVVLYGNLLGADYVAVDARDALPCVRGS